MAAAATGYGYRDPRARPQLVLVPCQRRSHDEAAQGRGLEAEAVMDLQIDALIESARIDAEKQRKDEMKEKLLRHRALQAIERLRTVGGCSVAST